MKDFLFGVLVMIAFIFAAAFSVTEKKRRELEYKNAELVNRLVVVEREYGKVERLGRGRR
jgi:uncharacterized protein YwlG (UPF0340 family)